MKIIIQCKLDEPVELSIEDEFFILDEYASASKFADHFISKLMNDPLTDEELNESRRDLMTLFNALIGG